jgi:hypothetical protein
MSKLTAFVIALQSLDVSPPPQHHGLRYEIEAVEKIETSVCGPERLQKKLKEQGLPLHRPYPPWSMIRSVFAAFAVTLAAHGLWV